MFLVIYRPHNTMRMDTQYFGPFADHDTAYDYLCELPALGIHIEAESGPTESGEKWIHDLTPPAAGPLPLAPAAPVTPMAAASHYLALLARNGPAMAWAIRYEESLCESESDFDEYLTLIGE